MYFNTHVPVMSLAKAPVSTGGSCSLKYCKWEDVLNFPEINPQTGILSSSLQLKEGALLYYAATIDQTRAFDEQQKDSAAGPYFEILAKGNLQGSNAANILTLQKMTHHQWVVIIEDRNGVQRLIGDKDSGASFYHNYGSGTLSESRRTEIGFKWEYPLTAPIYTATAFDIIINGVTVTAGCLKLIQRFKVDAAGAPMNDGDTLYINAGLVNKGTLVLADGMALPVDDGSGAIDWTGSIQRHIEKTNASNTITFVGSVRTDEIIEVYALTL